MTTEHVIPWHQYCRLGYTFSRILTYTYPYFTSILRNEATPALQRFKYASTVCGKSVGVRLGSALQCNGWLAGEQYHICLSALVKSNGHGRISTIIPCMNVCSLIQVRWQRACRLRQSTELYVDESMNQDLSRSQGRWSTTEKTKP